MSPLERLRRSLPAHARDLAANLELTLGAGSLDEAQRWGVAVASGYATRHAGLAAALEVEAAPRVSPAVLEDARAAATLMAMTNVFFRFRHFVQDERLASLPARLRMTRLARPAAEPAAFDLMCLAVSAINGCEACVLAHERKSRERGLTEQHVVDAVRIAGTLQGVALALETRGADGP